MPRRSGPDLLRLSRSRYAIRTNLSVAEQTCDIGWRGGTVIMETLRVGQRCPELQGRAVDGSTLSLPDGLRGAAAVLLFYRGHW